MYTQIEKAKTIGINSWVLMFGHFKGQDIENQILLLNLKLEFVLDIRLENVTPLNRV